MSPEQATALDALPDALMVTLRRPVTFPATNGEVYLAKALWRPV